MADVTLHADERIDQLYSQDIQIIQSSQVFAFSLDAVLLGDFAQVAKGVKSQIVDLCAGNGAVGLFASAKTQGHITAVEIQPRLADMAQRSVVLNDLTQQMTVLNEDLLEITRQLPKDSVDTVLCNPPYFKDRPQSVKNPNPHLAIARHELSANLDQILAVTSDLLKMNGKAYFVHRPERLDDLFSTMATNRLAPKRIRFVHPKAQREANMVLIEMIKDGKRNGVRIMPPLVVYRDDGEYREEVHTLLYGKHK
ncbi:MULTISPECIES: tRNA1(Val) (adenine(37)-N6)-methyltransferase [Lactiplantibacillus]|uniref:Methyltransferase small domain-containing protein n=1 Tax=Lactiplantibacillus plantarum subsp. plantarum TaxID=337330 RepID=A0A2S3U377_LACPN|nr:tRNA1(Val) (adenine(37)-N6)-methyltransferase [Lactiplantibacillus plantarum]EYR70549.1 O-methyltransferase [Lactiplantibacillus plantarum WHE 92]AGE39557.1 Methyltransferase [Lactiplantibacillus plantarum ZJ316]AGL64364.2 Methyltransferase (Putative) [Lactiplantibacillus plantarum subsp. plantarum P-8]AGO08287.1 methyltransferase [Lactiplantibacillus plantarum 16]AMO29838.1 methyltransferase [Lactiplantibacillus plantarum]